MPRGVMAIAETQQEAERQAVDGFPQMRVVRSRQIDLSDFPDAKIHWCVVVEHRDPGEEGKLLQHDDPEAHCELEARELYAKLCDNPASLITGVIERVDCPACDRDIQIELPPPHAAPDPEVATCPACSVGLIRRKGSLRWLPA